MIRKPICSECLSMIEITRGRVKRCRVCRGDAVSVKSPDEIRTISRKNAGRRGGAANVGCATDAGRLRNAPMRTGR